MIWLTGHTHSGTTMLMSMLDGHPDCLVYPTEPFFYALCNRYKFSSNAQMRQFFLFNSRNSLHCRDEQLEFETTSSDDQDLNFDALSEALQALALHKKIPELSQIDFPHETFFSAYFARLVGDLESIVAPDPKQYPQAAFSALRAAVTATRPEMETGPHLAFKDPLGQFRPGMLDWFLNTWPDGKVVFLRRDTHARVWSHIQHDVRHGRPNVRLSTDRSAFTGVCKSYARDRIYSSLLPDNDRILKIDYEALVTNPRKTMAHVCDFLGIAFDECVTRSTCLGIDAKPRTNRTGSNKINTNSLLKWKGNLTKAEQLIIKYYLLRASSRKLYGKKSYSAQAVLSA